MANKTGSSPAPRTERPPLTEAVLARFQEQVLDRLLPDVERWLYALTLQYHLPLDLVPDMLQETLLRAYVNAGRLYVNVNPRPYLFKIAHGIAFDYKRLAARRHETAWPCDEDGNLVEHLGCTTRTASQDLEYDEMQARIGAVVGRFIPRHQMIWKLHLDGYSNPEVGAIVGSAAQTVAGVLCKIRKAIADMFAEDEVEA
jgi:RNA polymerase sigma factor (sigma-70 family)